MQRVRSLLAFANMLNITISNRHMRGSKSPCATRRFQPTIC
jgi:hypothetical protein